MNHGEYVLDLLRKVPKTEKTIVLIRHSHRISFQGIPDHRREGIAITPEGALMARAFGEALAQIVPDKRILLGHTPAKRCRMTAESIGCGYASMDRVRILGCRPEVGSVVADPDNYIRLREELGWRDLIRKWLNEELPEKTLENPRAYCDRTLAGLVTFTEMNPDDLMIVIAHDVTIFPILSRVFKKTKTSLEFLNGIVITGSPPTFEIRYEDGDDSLTAAWSGP
ncbi:MAG TPA: histidine phosphatase family protein [Methanoregula sp.]|nr:histidine phosphatase family protein [Methanoregula sp.]